ncbi:MAG TPA: DUF4232 domain-containing protein [Gemmatimonadales bacterium]
MTTGRRVTAAGVGPGGMRAVAAVISALLLLLLPAGALAAPEDPPGRVYFPQTGHYLAYGFLDYWRHEGALMTFGYPISEEFIDPQSGLTVQYFERAVFEYHPDAPEGWRVQLQRLGSLAAADRQGEQPFQPITATSDRDCTFYAPTGHRLCFGFRDYWQNHGGLRIFGYPISEEFTENGLTVQYFERARFEYHPGNPPGYQVLLGLLGSDAAQAAGVATAPVSGSSGTPAYSPNLWPPERCHTWQLQPELGEIGAAAGNRKVVFVLRNESQIACTLYGYPGMQMLDGQGNPLPTHVIRGGGYTFTDVPPATVLLDPGASASFAAGYAVIPTGDQSHDVACPTSARLLITPPNAFDQLAIPAMLDPCEGDIYVSPVVAGTTGP